MEPLGGSWRPLGSPLRGQERPKSGSRAAKSDPREAQERPRAAKERPRAPLGGLLGTSWRPLGSLSGASQSVLKNMLIFGKFSPPKPAPVHVRRRPKAFKINPPAFPPRAIPAPLPPPDPLPCYTIILRIPLTTSIAYKRVPSNLIQNTSGMSFPEVFFNLLHPVILCKRRALT